METPSTTRLERTGAGISGSRRWVGMSLAVSLLVMLGSGLGLFAWHDVPQPEAATGSFLGIDYEVWSHLHLISSIIFTVAAMFHLRLNWRPLLRHFATTFRGL